MAGIPPIGSTPPAQPPSGSNLQQTAQALKTSMEKFRHKVQEMLSDPSRASNPADLEQLATQIKGLQTSLQNSQAFLGG